MSKFRKYSCASCAGKVEKTPCVSPGHKGKDAAVVYSGLHGWTCENCGTGKRSVSVNRDLSGGKEADKGNRIVACRASRALKVKVTLFQNQAA